MRMNYDACSKRPQINNAISHDESVMAGRDIAKNTITRIYGEEGRKHSSKHSRKHSRKHSPIFNTVINTLFNTVSITLSITLSNTLFNTLSNTLWRL